MWYRVGDFSKLRINEIQMPAFPAMESFIREVRFRYQGRATGLKEVCIFIHYQGLEVCLEANELVKQNINKISWYYPFFKMGTPIALNSKSDLMGLLELLQRIQRNYPDAQVPTIINEIKNIYDWVFVDECKTLFLHHIPERKFTDIHFNPSKNYSRALKRLSIAFKDELLHHERQSQLFPLLSNDINFIKRFKRKFDYLLAQGANPNQIYGRANESLFFLLMHSTHYSSELNVMLESLVCYGGDIFLPMSYGVFKTPIEYAYEQATLFNRCEPFNILSAVLASIENSLTQHRTFDTKLHVEKTRIVGDEHTIVTQFSFANNLDITTIVKDIQFVSEKDLLIVQAMFNKYFGAHKNATQLQNEFDLNFKGKNKFLELIYTNGIVNGFVLFEIIREEKNVVLHCICSAIDPAYRGYFLMKLLIFRFAYCLQTLLDDYPVAVFFSALHYNSYRLIKDHLHFPKYQPKHVEELVVKILDHVFSGEFLYHHDPEDIQQCYVMENLHVVENKTAKLNNDFMRNFYLKHILGVNENASTPGGTRSVPCLFFVGDHNFNELLTLCYLILHIDFKQHTIELAQAAEKFLAQYAPIPQNARANIDNVLVANNATFFQSVKVSTAPTTCTEDKPASRL